MIELNTIYNESCFDTMKRIDDNSINMVMTSPPYWALRDYGTGENQLGLEPTFDLYIKHLCDIFDEVKRVLRKDGTCWVNLGDTYGGSGNASGHTEDTKNLGYTTSKMGATKGMTSKLMPKSLTMIPFRSAIEMVNRGWILRNTIIWHKRSCMPSSVKDRFTVDYEYLFFFSKNKKYYFEQQFDDRKYDYNKSIKYDLKGNPTYKAKYNLKRGYKDKADVKHLQGPQYHGQNVTEYDQGRNKRTVWTINPKPFPEAHFAVYPEELCEIPIKAGCPEFVCKKCGKPKKQIRTITKSKDAFNIRVRDVQKERIKHTDRVASKEEVDKYDEKHYNPTFDHVISDGCDCNAGFTNGIVYDPFFGSGTTGLVAHRLNRKFIGSEISKEYCKIAEKRLRTTKQIQFT